MFMVLLSNSNNTGPLPFSFMLYSAQEKKSAHIADVNVLPL